MIDSKDILTLLSIPCEEVSDVEIISDTKEITYVDIELKDNRSSCPFCFQNNIVIKDYYKVKIKNSNKQMIKEISEFLESVREDICDNYCKYRDTADEEFLCDVLRDGNPCPLDKLN